MVVNPTMRRLLAVRPGIHLSAVKDISTSQRDGYSADSRPSRSGLCKSVDVGTMRLILTTTGRARPRVRA